jgi:hypothetical protein
MFALYFSISDEVAHSLRLFSEIVLNLFLQKLSRKVVHD